MKKICVCGAFRLNDVPRGGQEIKTCILADAIESRYGRIYRVDTLARCSRVRMPFQLLWAMLTCSDILMLPSRNGLIVLSVLLTKLNLIFHRRLHYSVIGGWLQDFLPNHLAVLQALHNFFGIYVETQTMKDTLLGMGFKNISVVPNCKPLDILDESRLTMFYTEPYKFVTFSRVTPKKGIGEAVDIVKSINKKFNREVCTLDIYGPIEPGCDSEWFEELKHSFSSSIHYMGNAPFDRSVQILSNYFALLFPTQFYTEGIPGTIIDAFAAGIPVISSRWKSYSDVIQDAVNGYGYEFNNNIEFQSILEKIIVSPELIISLKKNCLGCAERYLPENAINLIQFSNNI